MRIFCNICFRSIGKENSNGGLITSCCHILCFNCVPAADQRRGAGSGAGVLLPAPRREYAGGPTTSSMTTTTNPATIRCPKCRRQCSMIAIARDMNANVRALFADPRPMLMQLGKTYRFQVAQLRAHQRQARKLQQQRQRHAEQRQAEKAATVQRAGMLRQLRPRITLLRTELRNKFTAFVQAIRRDEPLAEVRAIYQSALRTFARSRKLVEMTLPKLEINE